MCYMGLLYIGGLLYGDCYIHRGVVIGGCHSGVVIYIYKGVVIWVLLYGG